MSVTWPEPDATCDGGDLDCGSGLLLIIRTAMAPLGPGGTLLVKSRERSVREDLPAWCRMVGHSLLGERAADGGYVHFLLRKKQDDDALAGDLERARQHVWQARARWSGGMQSKVTMRNHGLLVGQPASFDTADAAPSSLELVLGAVASALATGCQWRLSQRGIAGDGLEVVCRGRADLTVFLGVGAGPREARAGLESVELTAHVAADCTADVLEQVFADTVQRCPVTQSLARGATVHTQVRPV